MKSEFNSLPLGDRQSDSGTLTWSRGEWLPDSVIQEYLCYIWILRTCMFKLYPSRSAAQDRNSKACLERVYRSPPHLLKLNSRSSPRDTLPRWQWWPELRRRWETACWSSFGKMTWCVSNNGRCAAILSYYKAQTAFSWINGVFTDKNMSVVTEWLGLVIVVWHVRICQ